MELLLLAVLILLNGVFSMSEMAIVSSRKARLQQRVETGSHGARMALRLVDDPSHFLSTVQVGITTIGILSGAFGENAIAERLIAVFDTYPTLAPYSQILATVIMVITITYLSVVVGELVPKRLALLKPEGIASVVATPMYWLSRLVHPLVVLFSLWSSLLLRLLGAKTKEESAVTEDEIRVMIDQGTESGVFEESERLLIGNVFQLDDLRVTAIMTPRVDVVYLDTEDSPEAIQRTLIERAHDRLPVCHGSLDHVLGVVEIKDLLARHLAGEQLDLKAAMHTALFVPETMTPMRLLELFKKQRNYLAIIVDEYGAAKGLVTLTDVLEAIVGESPGASSNEGDAAIQRDDGSWLIDARLPIGRFQELLGIRNLQSADSGHYHTVGGFVLHKLGHMPTVGQHVVWDGWRFEVVDIDGHRIDKLLVMRVELSPAALA